jgi:ribosomal protein L11 methylase PrmA
MSKPDRLGASFRDPSGFLFTRDGRLYRQVNHLYAAEYDRLMTSGLYDRLVKAGMLIPHREVDLPPAEPDLAYKVIQPESVRFISYPYEWSFDQLKDAALTTLTLQRRALKAGMSLKDASAYNIQFFEGRPVLIDTLSFETYREGLPWVAYRQFCQHFLAPLALMTHRDVRLGQLLRIYIDGVPLDLASRLLPWRTRFNLGLFTHIHVHAAVRARFADRPIERPKAQAGMSRQAMLVLLNSPRTVVSRLFNTGVFSRQAAGAGAYVVAFDIDPLAVAQNYRQVKEAGEKNILPLMLDLTNPSPSLGWDNRERDSLAERGPADLVLALALVHHLAISNNVPLPQLADFFAGIGRWLIIEFVPKSDSQVQKLLRSREDIFPHYTREGFEQSFGRRFKIHAAVQICESERMLYLMERL